MENENEIRLMKFYSLSLLNGLAILTSIYLIYSFLKKKSDRQKYSNHLMVSLLIISLLTCLIDIPLILFYLWNGSVLVENEKFCLIWNFIDLSLYALISLLMCWTSIERYLFIFVHRYQTNRRLIRYFRCYGIVFLLIYVATFYFLLIFIHRCENSFNYQSVVCGELCYYSSTRYWAMFDQLMNNICPSLIIALINLSLFIRVLWQKKYRMRQRMTFEQHRRMVLQLIPVAILYLSGVIPYGIFVSIHLLGYSTPWTLYLQGQCFYLFYYIAVLLPLTSLISSPFLFSKCRHSHRVDVFPTVIPLRTHWTN